MLSEPVFVPFNVFSAPQQARFELKVTKPSKFNAVINMEASQKNSGTLMDFARHLNAAGAVQRLPLQAHVKISRIDNKQVILDYTADSEELYASSRTQLSFRILTTVLEKGEYEVAVDTLAALAPIDGVTSSFGLFVRKL